MPKAMLVFKLPEEKEDFDIAKNAIGYYVAISELDTWLRNLIKYEDKKTIKTQEVRDTLRQLMDGLEY